METPARPDVLPLDLTIRCGLELTYEADEPTPALLIVKARSGATQRVERELLAFDPPLVPEEFEDAHGNLAHRIVLPTGRTTVRHDALVAVPSVAEDHAWLDGPIPVEELPANLLRYTLPSRYCDSDKLMDFAYAQFGEVPHGLKRVQAICAWVNARTEYRWGGGNPQTAASDLIDQRFGVCRDFAHTAIALCRCFNLPARYVSGYVPDVAFQDPGTPMDFHAYFQVYIAHRWQTFDARFNVARTGRIHIAAGLDAVDGAFSTLYGAARLAFFNVWAFQVDASGVDIGDPVDLSKRLDGTPELRFPEL